MLWSTRFDNRYSSENFHVCKKLCFFISTSETQTKEEPGSVEADGEDDHTVTPGRVKEGCVKVGEVSGV